MKRHYSDETERRIAEALEIACIEYEYDVNSLDFYIPACDVYIEVKRFHSNRAARQVASQKNVILVQGLESVKLMVNLLAAKAIAQV